MESSRCNRITNFLKNVKKIFGLSLTESYMGRTGYSKKENTNNIDESHLHFGLQLIFDESQREGNGEIWVSAYELVKFLSGNRSEVSRNDETKEWDRVYQMQDLAVEEYVRKKK